MNLRPTPVAALLLVLAGCGGSSTAPPVDTTTSTTTSTTVNPVTTPPTTVEEDPMAKCAGLAAGPVARYAISPREHRADGAVTDIRVRARPNFDEVWCVDKDKEHRLDFNSNQRNAQGRECCWTNDPEWDFEDPDRMVQSGATIANTRGFNYRIRMNPRGERGTVFVQASIDGIQSHDWQGGSGYNIQPLRVVAMSKNEIDRDCQCIYRGNGIYEGDRCPK